MPFDQQAAVDVAAEAARAFAEGLRGIVRKAEAEVNGEGQKLVEGRKRLEADRKALEDERKRLEGDIHGLADERKRLATDRSSLDDDRKGLEKDRATLEELRKGFNNDRTGLNRDRAVLAQERAMFEKQQAELSKAREEFCKERVDFEETKELAAKKQAQAAALAPAACAGADEPSEMVVLNLGGESNITVFLSTLLQCPESRFTSVFSQRHQLTRDANGRIFVDFKPALFMPLLEHLRMRRIEEPSDPTPPPEFDSPELEGQFHKMLLYYGLKDWVYRTGAPAQPRPEAAAGAARRPAENGHQQPSTVAAARLPPPVVGARLQDAAQKVVEAEAKVRETIAAAAPLSAEDADSSEVETLKAASAKTLEAEKAAAIACAEAKKLLAAKLKDEQGGQEGPQYKEGIAKLQERLTAAQQELLKQRKVVVQGERLWKGKQAFSAQEAVVKQLESQLERATTGRTGVPPAAMQSLVARARGQLEAAAPGGEAQAQGYLAKLFARVNACQEKLASLGAKASPQQEVAERLSKAEQAVKQAVLIARPLSAQGGEELAPEKAQEVCESVGKAEREASEKVEEARLFLIEKQKQAGGAALSHFMSRINGMKGELAKASADASNYEHRVVAKMVMQQVHEVTAELEARVEKTREAVDPVVDDHGRCFIVAGFVRMIAEALDDHRQTVGITREALFLKIGPGAVKGKVTEILFCQFLGQMPTMCSQPNLSFNQDQHMAICKYLDKDKDGLISKADFMTMFCDRYVCLKETLITKHMKVVPGSTIGKLQLNEVVELVEDMESDAATGIVRAQVCVLKTGLKGWVTIRSNTGATYLSALTPYQDFVREVEGLFAQVPEAAAKALQCVNSQSADLQNCKQGPLLQTKTDLGKERVKLGVAQAKEAKLKKRFEDFKREYATRDAFERRKSAETLARKASTLSISAGAEST